MKDIGLLKRKLERERLARKQAEKILEAKATELYAANQSLSLLNADLEKEIERRTKSFTAKEAQYRVLVEEARDLIYNIDNAGHFLYVNAVGVRKFGYEEKDVINRSFIDFVVPEDVEKVYNYYFNLRETGKTSDYYEFRIKSKDNQEYWIGQNVNRINNADGTYYFSAVARDITKRKQTELALELVQLELQKSEVKYRSIIENMELGLLEVGNDGTILRVYERFNAMLGYEEGELVGKNANDTLLVDGYEEVLIKEDANRKMGGTGIYEVKLRKKDNSEIWVLISGAPFYDEKGEVAGSIGVHYDITDRKELQYQLEIARRKAVKAQQAEKAFLANMSHEIRTPLNAIIGMSHLLLDTKLNEEQKDFLDALNSSTLLLKNLISDILDISKIDAGSLDVQNKVFDVNDMCKKLIDTFILQSMNTDVNFELAVDNKIKSPIISDPQLLNQILLNLLSNAQKFTEEGSVKLSASIVEEQEEDVIIQFKVEDTGIGISQENIHFIFEEFKQATTEIRNKYGGTGLGLSISNQLVKLMGSQLVVESTEGEGSVFYFDLKVQKGKSIEVDKPKEQEISALGKANYLILVVEDNAFNIKYISSLLKKWHFKHDICKDGQQAVDICQEKDYDLIFMDLQMPVMDGFEATQIIRASTSKNAVAPIIALTASTFLSKKKFALKAGMTDFISKPFTPNQLSDVIYKYLIKDDIALESQSEFTFNEALDTIYLESAYGHDSSYALDMFETFVEIIDEELILIRDVLSRNDIEEIRKSLHRIKPTFTMVGLSDLTLDIENVEHKLINGEDVELQKWYRQFESQLNNYLPIIKEEIQKIEEWQKK